MIVLAIPVDLNRLMGLLLIGTAFVSDELSPLMINSSPLMSANSTLHYRWEDYSGSHYAESRGARYRDDGKALVKLCIQFSSTNADLKEAVDATTTSVAKTITVGRDVELSLSPPPSGTVNGRETVYLYGCVALRIPDKAGEKVSLSLTPRGSQRSTVARGTLNTGGCYRKPHGVLRSGTTQATLGKNTRIGHAQSVKSRKVSLLVG